MMMTLGTSDAHAHEQLRKGARALAGFADYLVEAGGADLAQRALRAKDLTRELIDRLVSGDGVVDPFVIGIGALGTQRLSIHAQQIGPLQGDIVGELRPLQQLIDQPGAAVRTRVGEKVAGLGGRRQRADHVEVDAAQILRVLGRFRRQDVELAQLLVDVSVDEVVFPQRRVTVDALAARHDDAEGVHGALKAGHDGGVAGHVVGRHHASRRHAGQPFVVRLELRQGRHVGLVAVGITGDDPQLLLPVKG